jgi:hypothetical protein
MSVMPQLYVMTVHILLGAVLGFRIVRAIYSKRFWLWPSCPMIYARYSRIAAPSAEGYLGGTRSTSALWQDATSELRRPPTEVASFLWLASIT